MNSVAASKRIGFTPALAAALCLASCSSSATNPETNTTSTVPPLTGQLGALAQQARFQACSARLGHFRDLKVWIHGGAKPGVARSAWDQLTDAEKSEIFDIAACVGSGGQVTETMVTVAQEGNGPDIETRRVANDRDFAAEVR